MTDQTKKTGRAPRDLRLKDVPSDVMDIIYDVQNELKKTAGRHVSMEKAFCRIVRAYKAK